MTEDEHLAAFGLRPAENLPAIRSVLEAEASQERTAQGEDDILLMKLCLVQLLNSGRPGDVLLTW